MVLVLIFLRCVAVAGCGVISFFAFCSYISHTRPDHGPDPITKANLCCTKLRLAGCEPNMPGRNPFNFNTVMVMINPSAKYR